MSKTNNWCLFHDYEKDLILFMYYEDENEMKSESIESNLFFEINEYIKEYFKEYNYFPSKDKILLHLKLTI